MPSLNPIGLPFVHLLRVESTNNYAMALVRAAMAQHGMAVFTSEQTSGKGQRERTWISEPGSNIAISIVIEPVMLDPARPFLLGMATALAVHDLLSGFISEGLSIKWPNDLYWNDRKAAGILIENVWQGSEWKFAICGIGINVNQSDFGELKGKAVSLLQITGKKQEPLDLAKELCEKMNQRLVRLVETPESISAAYNERLYQLNRTVKFRQGSRVFEARIRSVATNGQLVLEHGMEERFSVGEIEWII